ncbi:MAG: methyltransferase regulatory domain-containing protein [Planctomycetaceae bacterium]
MSETSYDRVPYRSHSFPQTHPQRLATIAALFGLTPPDIAVARVLELGCASGGNLLPIADQYPNSAAMGIDGSIRQIEQGHEIQNAVPLTNATLSQLDIRQFASSEPFDYILCHGVYSWVPDDVQDAILNIIRSHLAPDGVAYVSYNTYPGWNMRGTIRDVMRFRAQSFEDPREQLAQARGLLKFLSDSVRSDQNAYGILLKTELESISRADDSYLIHEHLEDVNRPLYFFEFAQRLQQHSLQYLGEADYGIMSTQNFPPPIQSMLQSVARNRIEVEQYMDFLRNRAFRQTLICHADRKLSIAPDPASLLGLRVASNAQSESPQVDVKSSDKVIFRRRSSVLSTSEPVVKAAMVQLRSAWPRSIPFAELAASARAAIAGRAIPVESTSLSPATEDLARTLLRCFETGINDLIAIEAPFTVSVSELPLASPLARVQARTESHVTNRRHERVSLDDIQRFVLLQLDGKTSVNDIRDRVEQAVASGRLVLFTPQGERISSPDQLGLSTHGMVPSVLESLAMNSLLIS